MNLSPHFSLEELTATQHREIDNTAPPEALANLKRTAQGLEEIRLLLGVPVIVSSGYRCPTLNKAVGGQPNSQHLTGQAADFIAPQFGSPRTVASRIADAGLEVDQCIVEFDRWCHVSFSANPRRQFLVIDHTGSRPMFA